MTSYYTKKKGYTRRTVAHYSNAEISRKQIYDVTIQYMTCTKGRFKTIKNDNDTLVFSTNRITTMITARWLDLIHYAELEGGASYAKDGTIESNIIYILTFTCGENEIVQIKFQYNN